MNISRFMFTSTLGPKYEIDIPSDRECPIRLRTFGELFVNSVAQDHFYIASVHDLQGAARFYEGRKAHRLLKNSFVDPITKQTIITVTFYKFSQKIADGDKQSIVIMKPIKTCTTPEQLALFDELSSPATVSNDNLTTLSKIIHTIKDLSEKLTNDPTDTEALSQIVSLYVDGDCGMQYDPWAALCFIQSALKKNPEHEFALRKLIHLSHYELAGETGPLFDPIVYLENALESNPNHRYALAVLVRTCLEKFYGGGQNVEKTLFRLERALAVNPCDEYALHAIVMFYTQPIEGCKKDLGAAIHYIVAGLENNPQSRLALDLLNTHKNYLYENPEMVLTYFYEALENIKILSTVHKESE